jgi:superfamily I DNA and/or RNA helicase
MSARYGEAYKTDVEIATICGLQAKEKQTVILSCVITNSSDGIVNDLEQINIALTIA